jgi:CrcB protein
VNAALTLLAVAGAGGCGAVLRFSSEAALTRLFRGRTPAATLVINVVGSFLLGLLLSQAAARLGAPATAVLGTGLLGGFTTFSSSALQSVTLWMEHRRWAALAQALGGLVVAAAAAAAGLALGAH